VDLQAADHHSMAAAVAEAGAAVVELAAVAAGEEAQAVVTAVIQETAEEDISLPFFCFIASVFYNTLNSIPMREAMLFVHFLGLILGMGSGFASLFIGLYNKTIPKDEAPKFVLRLRSLGYMGLAGIILLILSGGYLATPYWSMIGSMPYFITKLALVFVLTVIVILIDQKWRRAIKNNGGADLAAIQKLGRLAFPVGILILLFAVLQFR
jgi:hypothetical protein